MQLTGFDVKMFTGQKQLALFSHDPVKGERVRVVTDASNWTNVQLQPFGSNILSIENCVCQRNQRKQMHSWTF